MDINLNNCPIYRLGAPGPRCRHRGPGAYIGSCSSPPPKNSQNLCNPLWRALASKPLNRLSSFTPFYKWEAMMNLHILSDPVSDFWKCPKKGFKKSYLRRFLVPNFTPRLAPPLPGVTHEACLVISCSSIWRRLQKSSSLRANSWLFEVDDRWRRTNCTVLYCTVVNYQQPNIGNQSWFKSVNHDRTHPNMKTWKHENITSPY